MKLKSLLFLLALAFILPSISIAAPAVNTEDRTSGLVTMDELAVEKVLTAQEMKFLQKEEKKQAKMERRIARVEKFMNSKMGQRLLGGLDDPVDKWFWYWIIGWGAAIVFSILAAAILTTTSFGIFGVLSLLFGLFGTISLVVWLVQKFS